jgi:ribonuclease P protein component
MERLKRRTDFRAAAQGVRAPAKAFVLQARRRGDEGAARLGFTVSRQVGNAVKRNRVRRRLREIVRLADAGQFCAGYDYVLIGRPTGLQLPFADMTRDFTNALRRVHAAPVPKTGANVTGGNPAGAGSERSLHKAGSPSRPPRQEGQRGKPRHPIRHEPSRHEPSRHAPQRQDPKPEPKDEP